MLAAHAEPSRDEGGGAARAAPKATTAALMCARASEHIVDESDRATPSTAQRAHAACGSAPPRAAAPQRCTADGNLTDPADVKRTLANGTKPIITPRRIAHNALRTGAITGDTRNTAFGAQHLPRSARS